MALTAAWRSGTRTPSALGIHGRSTASRLSLSSADHLDKDAPCLVRAGHFSWKRDAAAVDAVASPHPHEKAQPVHGRHRRLVGRFAGMVRDAAESVGMIGIHVLNDP